MQAAQGGSYAVQGGMNFTPSFEDRADTTSPRVYHGEPISVLRSWDASLRCIPAVEPKLPSDMSGSTSSMLWRKVHAWMSASTYMLTLCAYCCTCRRTYRSVHVALYIYVQSDTVMDDLPYSATVGDGTPIAAVHGSTPRYLDATRVHDVALRGSRSFRNPPTAPGNEHDV
jgi:hypothetical protein